MVFTRSFQLSVTQALRDQLLTALDALDAVSLDDDHLSEVEERPGVYQLFVDGELVYIGKAKGTLRGRLRQHQKKLGGRTADLLRRTQFKCAYVSEDLDAIAPETMLIAHYREQHQAAWNFNGFGNKDPGRNRDRSLVKATHFDSLYPVDLDQGIDYAIEREESLLSAMTRFKNAVPFVFRFDKLPQGLTIEAQHSSRASVREWLNRIGSKLPVNWSMIALPGYVIAYSDLRASDFRSRIGAWTRSEDGAWRWEAHLPEYDSAPVDTAAPTDVDE